jgi:flagellar biogenesis protein FliO
LFGLKLKSLVVVAALSAVRASAWAEPVGPAVPLAAEGTTAREVGVQKSAERLDEKSVEARPLGGVRGSAAAKPAGGAAKTQREADKSAGHAKADSLWSGTAGPLVAVLGLIGIFAGVFALVLRGRGGLSGSLSGGRRAPAGILEVLGRYPLSRSQTLVLLKVDRRVLLLSETKAGRLGATQTATLCEITEPEEVASILIKVNESEQNSLASRFSTVLRTLDREAGEKLEVVEAPSLSRRAAPVMLPQSVAQGERAPRSGGEMTGAQAAASIRSRLQAIRVGGAA